MLRVGITGGIGTGKSTVAKLFSILGVPVYESDKRAKWIIENHHSVISELKSLLGAEAYGADGKYNRNFVASAVFQNQDLLTKLNQIVHPRVAQDFEDWTSLQNTVFVLKEAAIMNRNSGLDKIIVVDSPKELRLKRLLQRDYHKTKEELEKVIANQKTELEFIEMADFVVKNDENSMLIPQVLEIYTKLTS
jgi:dephospho-CoA kinase